VAAARKVELTSVESTLTGDMDVRGALGVDDEPRNGFERIGVSFRVTGNAPDEKLREIVRSTTRPRTPPARWGASRATPSGAGSPIHRGC
jgi:uncharacterized OsmC-like protein